MRKIWTICQMELARTFKRKQSLLIMFALPLLFTFIFGGLSGSESSSKAPIGVVDEDNSFLSAALVNELRQENPLITVKKVEATTANQQLANKKVAGVFFIDKGFQEDMRASELGTELTFKKIPEYTESALAVQWANDLMSQLSKTVYTATVVESVNGENWQKVVSDLYAKTDAAAKIDIRMLGGRTKSTAEMEANNRAAGFSIMFVMIMIMSVAGIFLESRQNGVWYRLLTTSASRIEIIVGYLLAFFIIGWVQFGILMVATHYLFGIVWGNVAALILLVSLLLVAIVGLGLMIAGIVKTTEQQAAVSNLVVAATCMISGVYWPLEVEPQWMQTMAEWLPQTWAMNGFVKLVGTGGGVMSIYPNLLVLLGFGALFLMIGIRRIKFE